MSQLCSSSSSSSSAAGQAAGLGQAQAAGSVNDEQQAAGPQRKWEHIWVRTTRGGGRRCSQMYSMSRMQLAAAKHRAAMQQQYFVRMQQMRAAMQQEYHLKQAAMLQQQHIKQAALRQQQKR